jgi:hypothetical protein
MSMVGDGVDEIPPPPKGDGSGGKTTPIDGASRDSHVEQLSSELKQLKLQRKIDKLKKKLQRILKAVNWLLPLHQMKRPMLHLKKMPRARKEKREIRDNTTPLSLTMIICLTLASSLRYPLIKSPVSMGRTIPIVDTR